MAKQGKNQVVGVLPAQEGEGLPELTTALHLEKGDKLLLSTPELGNWLKITQITQTQSGEIRLIGVSQGGLKAKVKLNPTDRIRRI